MSFAINKTELINAIKESVNLRPEDSSGYVEYCLKMTVVECSKKFSRLFYLELTKDSDANGVITLPNDTFKVISVQNSTIEAQPLDLRTAMIYQNRDIEFLNNIYYTVKQTSTGMTLQLVPTSNYTDVSIICQTLNDGVGNIPAHYEEVLLLGARYKYLSTKRPGDIKLLSNSKKDYRDKLDELALEQNKLAPDSRWKQYYEADWERNFITNIADETLDRYYI